MADSNAASILSVYTTVNSKLADLPVENGQLIFVRDKHKIALDFGGQRKIYNQIEELSSEEARTSLLAPVTDRYYYVLDPPVLWRYQESGWVQITTPPENLSAVEQAAKEYADTLNKRVTGSVDTDGSFIIMFDEPFWEGSA